MMISDEYASDTTPTPKRQPDWRLSNLVLMGGAHKRYPSAPLGSSVRTKVLDAICAVLFVGLVVIIVLLARMGCSVFWCPWRPW